MSIVKLSAKQLTSLISEVTEAFSADLSDDEYPPETGEEPELGDEDVGSYGVMQVSDAVDGLLESAEPAMNFVEDAIGDGADLRDNARLFGAVKRYMSAAESFRASMSSLREALDEALA